MDLMAFIGEYGPWAWIVGGLILLAIELLAPGGIFVWLGSSAIVTGLISFLLPMGLPMQWAVYGMLCIVAIVLWLKYGRKAMNTKTDNPFLNKRAKRLVGRETVLKEAIEQGFGTVKMDDSVWRVSGIDLKQGTKVKISGYEGTILKVEEVS